MTAPTTKKLPASPLSQNFTIFSLKLKRRAGSLKMSFPSSTVNIPLLLLFTFYRKSTRDRRTTLWVGWLFQPMASWLNYPIYWFIETPGPITPVLHQGHQSRSEENGFPQNRSVPRPVGGEAHFELGKAVNPIFYNSITIWTRSTTT